MLLNSNDSKAKRIQNGLLTTTVDMNFINNSQLDNHANIVNSAINNNSSDFKNLLWKNYFQTAAAALIQSQNSTCNF